MTWTSQTLADSLPSVFNAAEAAVAAAQKELNAVDAAIDRLQALATNAQARVDAADQLVSDLSGDAADSGIYNLILTPGTGVWSERILWAAGAPPRDPYMYSAIVCTLSLTADLSAATDAKNRLQQAVSTPFLPAPPTIRLPSLTPPPMPVLPSLPEPAALPEDEWVSATVADLFPGTRDAVNQSVESVKKEANKILGGITKLQDKKSELQAELDEASALVANLASTGVYAFSALPEVTPSADWYDRLIAGTEAEGRPPFNPALYSAGTCTVVLATSYAQLLERFGKLQSILSTSLT